MHPSLLFSASDVPTLRARTASGDGARAWATLKQRIDDYVTSPAQSNWHLDPAKIGARDSNGVVANYAAQNEMPTMLIDLAFGYVITGDTTYSRLVNESMTSRE
jgi:hypothetical protein